MPAFKEFQAQRLLKLKERLQPDWQPPNPQEQLPFNLGQDDWDWLNRNIPLDAPNLVELSKDDLYALFPPIKYKTRIIRTFIWQSWLRIQMGELNPIGGNIRSFWYQHLEGFAYRYGLLGGETRRGDGPADRIIETMGEQVGEFISHRIFRYTEEMNFVSPLGALWKVGRKRRGWLFFTEKEGLWKLCEALWKSKERSMSVMASNGEPSGLILEKLAMDLWRLGVRKLTIGTFCDWDPWGWCIDATMDAILRRFGFEVSTWRLVTPDLFTAENLKNARDYSELVAKPPVNPSSKETLILNWCKMCGGINGKPLAVHSDVIAQATRERRIQAFIKALEAGKQPPGIWVDPQKDQKLIAPHRLQKMFR